MPISSEPSSAATTASPNFYAVAFFGSWIPPFVLLVLMLRDGHHGPHALLWIAYGAVAGTALWSAGRIHEGRIYEGPGIFLLLASLHLFVVTPELALRHSGFRYEHGMRMGEGVAARFVRWTADGELFWTLPPGPNVNGLGFRTRPLPAPDTVRDNDSVIRIWVQGDSVAQQGFPEIAETSLNLRSVDRRFEVYNFSMAGWSSEQGRRLVDNIGPTARFDRALLAYGWNDHWTAMGAPDHLIEAPQAESRFEKTLQKVYRSLRIAQAARLVFSPPNRTDDGRRRVPEDRFRDNLVVLGEAWLSRGTQPVLMTLPSGHRLGIPDYLSRQGFIATDTDVVALHGTYAALVRQVARERGWPLLDLAAELDGLPAEDLAPLFLTDGIHLSEQGLAVVGKRTADFLAQLDEDVP